MTDREGLYHELYEEIKETLEPPTPKHCGCIGHFFPDVHHSVACCDVPHITKEEYSDADRTTH